MSASMSFASLPRSINRAGGAEFTYQFWLLVGNTDPAVIGFKDILVRGEADMVAIARSVLYKPHWGWEAAAALGGEVTASHQYWRSIPRDVQAIFGKIHIGMR